MILAIYLIGFIVLEVLVIGTLWGVIEDVKTFSLKEKMLFHTWLITFCFLWPVILIWGIVNEWRMYITYKRVLRNGGHLND